MTASPAVRRALRAVARQRSVGLHFFGHFAGIELVGERSDGAELRLERFDPEVSRALSPYELGTFADLTMGQSIRTRMPEGLRLATSSLALHHGPTSVARAYLAVGEVQWLDLERRTATATCRITDETGRLVVVASGSFSALPPPRGVTLKRITWDVLEDGVPGVGLADLEGDEERAVRAVGEAVALASSGDAVVEELVGVRWSEEGDTLVGTLDAGPQHVNRVGHLQGGLIYGLAATAAQRLVPGASVVEGHVQFLRAGQPGPVQVRAERLRVGRSVGFARVQLTQGGEVTVDARATLAVGRA